MSDDRSATSSSSDISHRSTGGRRHRADDASDQPQEGLPTLVLPTLVLPPRPPRMDAAEEWTPPFPPTESEAVETSSNPAEDLGDAGTTAETDPDPGAGPTAPTVPAAPTVPTAPTAPTAPTESAVAAVAEADLTEVDDDPVGADDDPVVEHENDSEAVAVVAVEAPGVAADAADEPAAQPDVERTVPSVVPAPVGAPQAALPAHGADDSDLNPEDHIVSTPTPQDPPPAVTSTGRRHRDPLDRVAAPSADDTEPAGARIPQARTPEDSDENDLPLLTHSVSAAQDDQHEPWNSAPVWDPSSAPTPGRPQPRPTPVAPEPSAAVGQIRSAEPDSGATGPADLGHGRPNPDQTWHEEPYPEQTWHEEPRPDQTWHGGHGPHQTWPAEQRADQTWPGEQGPGQSWPGEQGSGQSWPAEQRPDQTWHAEQRPGHSWPGEQGPTWPEGHGPAPAWPAGQHPGQSWPTAQETGWPAGPHQAWPTAPSGSPATVPPAVVHPVTQQPAPQSWQPQARSAATAGPTPPAAQTPPATPWTAQGDPQPPAPVHGTPVSPPGAQSGEPPSAQAAPDQAATAATPTPQSWTGDVPPPMPVPADPQRMSSPRLSDFLAQQAPPADLPATWGLRGLLTRMGLRLTPTAAERAHRQALSTIQRPLGGPKTIVVVNQKGGAGKTPATFLLAAVIGRVRGGFTLAWDNNENAGTLGWKGIGQERSTTVVDLLGELDRFTHPELGRIGDLDNFVRSQGDDRFDLLASNQSTDQQTTQIGSDDFHAIHEAMSRYYRVLLVDTGNNDLAPNWRAALDAADQIVVPIRLGLDYAGGASRTLDVLDDIGHGDLVRNAVVIVSQSTDADQPDVRSHIRSHFGPRVRAIVDVPFDPELVEGRIVHDALRTPTRQAWTRAAAAVVSGL